MNSVKALFIFFLLLSIRQQSDAQPLKIMPMGNSITYDDNVADKTNPRPVGERISYRYRLFQLINEAGYEFDFVGSENSGNNYFQNPDYDDNAGFSGINDGQLAYLIKTGYNQRSAQYEAPGPYLLYYPADVVLLHIGTNDLDINPNDVRDILDNIRFYDSDVIVLVARIINRNPYSSMTTTFNNNVEAMVNARGDSRIKMVNMENGAGINYSTDMADYLHPNTTGYNKMAAKWFEALNNLNTPPEISSIPELVTVQGTAFSSVYLDDYVTDTEDNDNEITWRVQLKPGTKLTATIDENRILQLGVNDIQWFGTDTIILRAIDSGNGAFKKSDSVSVPVKITKGNEPPVIISTPVTTVNEDANYNYNIVAEDNDGDELVYSAIEKPSWLSFSSFTHVLSGKPSNDDVGTFSVLLQVSDGDEYAQQSFNITVVNINDYPVITSNPPLTVKVGEPYLYEFMATDEDSGDILTYSVIDKPSWLTFSNGQNKALLYGAPSVSNIGANCIILSVSDGHTNILHGFTIVVNPPVSSENSAAEQLIIHPNPVKDKFRIVMPVFGDMRIVIYDLTGAVRANFNTCGTCHPEMDISSLPNGLYIYKAFTDNETLQGKIVKSE